MSEGPAQVGRNFIRILCCVDEEDDDEKDDENHCQR